MWDNNQQRTLVGIKGQKPLKSENLTFDQQCFQRKILIKRGTCKKLINRNFIYIELGDQKAELSCPMMTAEHNRKKDSSSFLARTQPMKGHRLCLLGPFQYPFPFDNNVLLPLLGGDLLGVCHGCRPWTAILCCTQINPSLLEKYLASICFRSTLWCRQVNSHCMTSVGSMWVIFVGSPMRAQGLFRRCGLRAEGVRCCAFLKVSCKEPSLPKQMRNC